jgi:hypothetical protein
MLTESVVACFKALLRHAPGGIEGNHESLSQDGWRSTQDLNRTSLDYRS